MPSIQRSALVAYSSQAMFDLVNDVAAYPQFIPGCSDSKVLSESGTQMRASLLVSSVGVNQWFTTENKLISGEAILMRLVDGPFSHLNGDWRFVPLSDEACKIELDLDFSFKSKIAGMAFGGVFQSVASGMVTAFSQRAKAIYG